MQARLKGSKPAEVKDKAIAGLRQVSALLDAKAPGDAAAFKSWLQSIGQHVAEAAKEGGFLGFGGVQVSDAEKATLAEISKRVEPHGLRPAAAAGAEAGSAPDWPASAPRRAEPRGDHVTARVRADPGARLMRGGPATLGRH